MRSNLMKKGIEKAPHRSLFKACGLTDDELSKPIIGIANSANEIIPGHIHLNTIADAVKKSVIAAGGTPLEFALRNCGISALAIAGIAMEIGIKPTPRPAADLGLIPAIIADACGAGHADAAQRSRESLALAGDAMITDVVQFCELMARSQLR